MTPAQIIDELSISVQPLRDFIEKYPKMAKAIRITFSEKSLPFIMDIDLDIVVQIIEENK